MDNAKLKEFYNRFQNWLTSHSHIDRVLITLAGFIIIYLLWYIFFQKPLLEKIDQHHIAIATQKKEIAVFTNQIAQIKIDEKALLAKKKTEKISPETKVPLASQKDNDIIIQTILTPQQNVQFLRLNNLTPSPGGAKPPIKNDVELAFNSNYISTINYLSQLEKLPWCLSWDSLEYKVVKYPDAEVVINLHIVNS
jgi:type II secretory pathway component PulM